MHAILLCTFVGACMENRLLWSRDKRLGARSIDPPACTSSQPDERTRLPWIASTKVDPRHPHEARGSNAPHRGSPLLYSPRKHKTRFQKKKTQNARARCSGLSLSMHLLDLDPRPPQPPAQPQLAAAAYATPACRHRRLRNLSLPMPADCTTLASTLTCAASYPSHSLSNAPSSHL
jgi:hypothetical protein